MLYNEANDSAFPTPHLGPEEPGATGLTVREWFAGQAMIGILSNSDLPDLFKKGFAPSKMAEICFECARAMLAEAKKA